MGNADTAGFGVSGDVPSYGNDIAIQPNARIMVAGEVHKVSFLILDADASVFQRGEDGTVDGGFGTGGAHRLHRAPSRHLQPSMSGLAPSAVEREASFLATRG